MKRTKGLSGLLLASRCAWCAGVVALALGAACSHESAPRHPGTVELDTVSTQGATEHFSIHGPPGEVILRLDDEDGRCDFYVNAAQPPTSDLTAAATATRVQLLLLGKQPEIGDLLAGRTQTLTAHAGTFFTTDATVQLFRGRSATAMDHWYSTGGTVTIDALPAPGSSLSVHLSGVQLAPVTGNDKRMLDGTLSGEFGGAVTINGPGGHCPTH